MTEKNPPQPGPEQPSPDDVDTTVQSVAHSAGEVAAPAKNRLAWVSSPKVAAATVITVLALGGLGGAFALGRATAGPDHGDRDRILVGFRDGDGFGRGPGGTGFDRGFGGQPPGDVPQAPQGTTPDSDQDDDPAPSDGATSSDNG